jgi:hypothetical protein
LPDQPARDDPFRRIVLDHARRYPLWDVDDAYKLVHQAAMGPGHAVPDVDAARDHLEHEVAGLGAVPGHPVDPLVEVIGVDADLVRVHLRPYRDAGRPWEVLLQAFVRTARDHRPSIPQMERAWLAVAALTRAGDLPFTAAQVDRFGRQVAERGYPPVHHSPGYREAYRPTYRVVALAHLPPELRYGAARG